MANNKNTSPLEIVLSRIYSYGDRPAIFWHGLELTYSQFSSLVDEWCARLSKDGVVRGSICAYKGDYSPQICALMFALMKVKAIQVPLTSEVSVEMSSFIKIAGVQFLYEFDAKDGYSLKIFPRKELPNLILSFYERGHPGLIVFTSGSTGMPKGILHDCELIMKKFEKPRQSWRTILFLLMDHFGGFNTFLGTFANGGVAICPTARTANGIAKSIYDGEASLLPTTPTFLNLMALNSVSKIYDLSSVKLITYGTELMSEATLEQCRQMFPEARLKQTYGLSELGVLRSDSPNKNSLWVKIGGRGFDVKVHDGVLWVRSESNMVGYLNAPSPFDDDGWMCTGDEVEIDGEFIRFLGRKSEVINVGGKKVYPIEIENVLLGADNIKDATVFGKSHPIMGQVVYARVSLIKPESQDILLERLRAHCNQHLAQYKVPVRFQVVEENKQYSSRFKRIRREN